VLHDPGIASRESRIACIRFIHVGRVRRIVVAALRYAIHGTRSRESREANNQTAVKKVQPRCHAPALLPLREHVFERYTDARQHAPANNNNAGAWHPTP